MIVHAGDVGGRAVLAALEKIAPVAAVYGNVATTRDLRAGARTLVTLAGVTIHVRQRPRTAARPTAETVLAHITPVTCWFSGTPIEAVVMQRWAGRLAVNPGAAGPRRFDLAAERGALTIGGDSAPTSRLFRWRELDRDLADRA